MPVLAYVALVATLLAVRMVCHVNFEFNEPTDHNPTDKRNGGKPQ